MQIRSGISGRDSTAATGTAEPDDHSDNDGCDDGGHDHGDEHGDFPVAVPVNGGGG